MESKVYNVSGFREFRDLFSELKNVSEHPIVTLFCASLDNDGVSWCGDCRDALPVINEVWETAKKQAENVYNFVFVYIDKEEWKKEDNDFRSRVELKVQKIPTLILWEKGEEKKRLIEGECAVSTNVNALFL